MTGGACILHCGRGVACQPNRRLSGSGCAKAFRQLNAPFPSPCPENECNGEDQ